MASSLVTGPKYALVTGSNRGIGLEVSRKLLSLGKPIIMGARDAGAGAAAAKELSAGGSPAAVPLTLDTFNLESIKSAAAELASKYDQQIDLLVNNAGVLVGGGAWDPASWSSTMATNVMGPLDLTLHLAPHLAPGALVIMVSSGLGRLENLSPDYAGPIAAASSLDQLRSLVAASGFNPSSPMGSAAPGQGGFAPTYSVSKAALNRGVQLLAAEPLLRERGISVVATCPGWCRTRMGTDAADRSSEQGAGSVLWPALHWEAGLAGSFTRDGASMTW